MPVACTRSLFLLVQVESESLSNLAYTEVDPEETKNIEISEYPALTAEQINDGKEQYLRVTVPPHRSGQEGKRAEGRATRLQHLMRSRWIITPPPWVAPVCISTQ